MIMNTICRLVIYFMFSLIRGLRDANHELSEQLMVERTEEKKRIFELAGGGRKKHHNGVHKESSDRSAASPSADRLSVRSSPHSPSKYEDAKEKHSTSKSPTRTPFLPSLQSVHEDEGAEDEEEQATKQLLPRDSTQSSSEQQHTDQDEELPPIKFTLKQKMKVWLGLEDRQKLGAKLRMRQLAEKAYFNAPHDDEEEEPRTDKKRTDKRDERSKRKVSASEKNETLEEASTSTNEEYSEEPSTVGRRRRATPVNAQPWNIDEQSEENQDTVVNHRDQELLPRTSSSRHRTPASPKTERLGADTLTKRSHSMNDQRQPNPSFERDLASEASPLLEKRNENVREAEQHRLTQQKRSPPSNNGYHHKPSVDTLYEYSLERTPALYHGRNVGRPPEETSWNNNKMAASSEDPTRPPSEEASFRDPTPEFGMQTALTPEFELPENLLTYANPYSSYAAAMCSPVMAERMSSLPLPSRQSRSRPTPQRFFPESTPGTPDRAPDLYSRLPSHFSTSPTTPVDVFSQSPPPLVSLPPAGYVQFTPTEVSPLGHRMPPFQPRTGYATPASMHSRTPVSSPRSRPASAQPMPWSPPPVLENYPLYSHTFTRSPTETPYVQRSPYYNTIAANELLRQTDSSPSGGYASGSPTMYYMSEQDSGQGSGSGGDIAVRRYDIRQRTHMGPSTDESPSPDRSPSRQPLLPTKSPPTGAHQTTV